MRKRIDFICPTCKNKKRITINDEYNETHIDKILDRSLFNIKCDKCNTNIYLDYKFVLRTPNYSLSYGEFEDVDRICSTYDDIKEKILIYEDKLNDCLIELSKRKIEHDLKKELDLRYDGIVEDKLVFYSLKEEKSYSFNKELYDYYVNKYKVVNINNEEVNSSNYFKYIKD